MIPFFKPFVNISWLFLLFFAQSAIAQTPQLVRDIWPGSQTSIPATFIGFGLFSEGAAIDSIFYFTATDGINGIELWRSNGTSQGTSMVKDINPGSVNSRPERLTVFGNKLLFFATSDTFGLELWTSDGTAQGTQLVKDINAGPGSCIRLAAAYRERDFYVWNGIFYFFADAEGQFSQLWRSDGTPQGTYRVKAVCPSCTANTFAAGWLTPLGVSLYFISENDLWKSNGTEAGTVRFTDDSNAGAPDKPEHLQVADGRLYLAAQGQSSADVEPWTSNGTAGNTQQLKDIGVGAFSGSFPRQFTEYNSKTYFHANQELWVSNGTSASTSQFSTFVTGNYQFDRGDGLNMLVANNLLFFNARGNSGNKEYMYSTNGTTGNATQLAQTNDYGFFDIGLCQYKQKVCFWGQNNNETGIWAVNGSANGKVFYPVSSGLNIPHLWVAGHNLFFFNRPLDQDIGMELFKLPLNPDVALVAALTVTDSLSCAGGQNGSLSVDVSGGVGPYEYLWNPATLQGNNPTGLAAGTYRVTVMDAALNTTEQIITLTAPTQILVSVQTTPASGGLPNGAASASVTGGIMPYTYLWSTGVTTANLQNVIAGNYTVTITDANGCTKTATAVVQMMSGSTHPEADKLLVSPTLSSGMVQVSWTGAPQQNLQLFLIDQQGAVVRTWQDMPAEKLALGELPNGSYILLFNSTQGSIRRHIVLMK